MDEGVHQSALRHDPLNGAGQPDDQCPAERSQCALHDGVADVGSGHAVDDARRDAAHEEDGAHLTEGPTLGQQAPHREAEADAHENQ